MSSIIAYETPLTTVQTEAEQLTIAPHMKSLLYIASVVEFSFQEDRMDLWGEYDMISDLEFLTIVLPALARGARWRTLDMRRSGITLASIKALCKSGILTSSSSSLTELCLGSTSLGDEGVALLAETLAQRSCNIRSLSLFDNRITDEGVAVLAKHLPMSNLTTLNLSNNFISDTGALSLANAAKLSKLERLILNVNEIKETGASALLATFFSSSLRFVGLRGNDQVTTSSRLRLNEVIDIAHSRWYETTVQLLSVRVHARIGAGSKLQYLPNELIRQLCMMIMDDDFTQPLPPKEESEPVLPVVTLSRTVTPALDEDSADDEDDDSGSEGVDSLQDQEELSKDDPLTIEDREEIAGWKEDTLAFLAHDRRKWMFAYRLKLMVSPSVNEHTTVGSATLACPAYFTALSQPLV